MSERLPLRIHARRTLTLAVPVMLGRLGMFGLMVVDTAMSGHASARELAYYALASATQAPMMLLGIGLAMGAVVLTAQAHGAGEEQACGRVWRVAMAQALVHGALLAALCLAGEPLLRATGQESELAAEGGRVLTVLGWGLPGLFLFTATTLFLEGLGRPLPGMVVMLLANVLNAALNWVLIFGNLGAPALGAEGAAIATGIVRWLMFAALAGYVLTRIDAERFGLRGGLGPVRELDRRLRRIGLPMGVAHCAESLGFSTMTWFAGWVGATHVAAYTAGMNLIALGFMCAIGLATAASVRVGNAVGRGDQRGVAVAGWVAIGLSVCVMLLFAVLYRAFALPLAGLFGDDPEMLRLAVATIAVACLVLVPDAMQGVAMGALRGAGDVWPATGLYLLAFVAAMVPAGYGLGVALERGAPGLMQGVLVGTAVAAVLLLGRFRIVSRRVVRRA